MQALKDDLVADFLRKQEHPTFGINSITLTPTDGLPGLSHLRHQQRIDNFGETMFAYLQQSHELAQQPKLAADVLLNEILESVEQKTDCCPRRLSSSGGETPVHAVLDV